MKKSNLTKQFLQILRSYSLDFLSPILFYLFFIGIYLIFENEFLLVVAMLPLAFLSTTLVIFLKRFFHKVPSEVVGESRGRKTLSHFTNILHLHSNTDLIDTLDKADEIELIRFSGPEKVGNEKWKTQFEREDDVIIIEEDEDEEEIVSPLHTYVKKVLGEKRQKLPSLNPKKNEINSFIRRSPMPPLKCAEETHLTPWSTLFKKERVDEESEKTPLKALTLNEEKKEAHKELHQEEVSEELISHPDVYFANWFSLSIKTRDTVISKDGSFIQNPVYSIYKCSYCETTFASSKETPRCPACRKSSMVKF